MGPEILKKTEADSPLSVKTYQREYPMVIFNPEKKNGSRLSIFQSKHTIGSTLWSFSTQKKKRRQIVRFSVKTYHREYPMVIFNPEIKKKMSRLSVFQSKHTIGSTLWSFL